MRLNEINYSDAKPVEGYGPGFFFFLCDVWQGAVLTGSNGTQNWAGYSDVDALLALSDQIDVLFVGTGGEIAHLPQDFRAALEAAGLGVDAMSSPAACRTYNVLLSEGRRIALALIPV
ncbi:MAG: Mth938-like domain-containing protein [Sedimentitalea sp.]